MQVSFVILQERWEDRVSHGCKLVVGNQDVYEDLNGETATDSTTEETRGLRQTIVRAEAAEQEARVLRQDGTGR